MTPGDRMQKNIEAIERKCLSCSFGRCHGNVSCNHPAHPGIVGGLGSEWVFYCDHYSKKENQNAK